MMDEEPRVMAFVYGNDNYEVRVVRMPDMVFDTYGVINKATGVIEHIQPILYNARYIADQLNKWLTKGPTTEEDVNSFLEQFSSNGKAN